MVSNTTNSEHNYYLGVDVGGSKSHALITDQHGIPLGFGKSGGGNWEMVSYDGLKETLSSCIDKALAEAKLQLSDLTSIGFGIAGYDWESQTPQVLQTIKSIGVTQPFELVNDTYIGLLAGSEEGWGMVVVAGSGCNCRGWDEDGKLGRIISGDEWADEGGGGSFLVMNALRAITRQFTMRGDRTQLTDIFLAAKQVQTPAALIEGYALNQIVIDANDAPLVFEAERLGDPIAITIVDQSGRLLGDIAHGVIRQLELQDKKFEVVLVGSLYEGSQRLNSIMKQSILELAPGAVFRRLDLPPVVGGVLLAMRKNGLAIKEVRQHLIENCRVYLSQLNSYNPKIDSLTGG